METGRRDGLVSNAADVDLPSPSMTVAQSAAVFAAKDFDIEEMVVLLGIDYIESLSPFSFSFYCEYHTYKGRQIYETKRDKKNKMV